MRARAQGWGWLAPIAMSATTFAGSAQFAALSVLGAGGTVAAAVAAALLLNARYGPIGSSSDPPALLRFNLLRAKLKGRKLNLRVHPGGSRRTGSEPTQPPIVVAR